MLLKIISYLVKFKMVFDVGEVDHIMLLFLTLFCGSLKPKRLKSTWHFLISRRLMTQ